MVNIGSTASLKADVAKGNLQDLFSSYSARSSLEEDIRNVIINFAINCTVVQESLGTLVMFSARRIVLVLGIIVILLDATSVDAKKGRKKKKTRSKTIKPDKPGKPNGKCRPVSEEDSAIKLRCGSNKSKDVIYSIDINSYYNSAECNETAPGVCSGLQPSVLTDSNLCYSERTCSITFNTKAPIVKTLNVTCIGKTPRSLRASFKCIHRDIFYPLYKNGLNRTLASERTSDYGMLVSHDTYPWHYGQGLMVDMTLKPENTGKTKLFISVPVMELDFIADVVFIVDSGQDVKVNKTAPGTATLIRPSNEGKTVVKFYTDNNSSTAKGFIICFFWADETEDLSGGDICTKLKKKRKKKGGRKKKNKSRVKGEKKERRKKGKKKKKNPK